MGHALAIKPKVGGMAIGGELAIIATWLLEDWAHVIMPDRVEQAFTLLMALFVGYMIKEEAPNIEEALKQLLRSGIVKPLQEVRPDPLKVEKP